MLVSNVREATYICQLTGITPNVVKLRDTAKYDFGFDFTTIDKEVMKELFRLRNENENNKDIREQFEREMSIDTLIYLKKMLNATKY